MKRIVSLLLMLTMLLSVAMPVRAAEQTQSAALAAEAQRAAAEARAFDCPVVFVTGIGQTWTHLVNEDGSYKTDKNGELIEYNLFYIDMSALLQPKALLTVVKVVLEFVGSAVLARNLVSRDAVKTIFSAIASHNVIDKDGNLPPDVEDCVHNFPLSEYNELDLKNFYRSIPCKDILEGISKENIFCYNYSAFSFLYNGADGLDKFIRETALGDRWNKTGAEQVILIPMSMGASVVNAYLDRYGAQHDVKRVVSIVGAWNGSDLVADLVEGKYAADAPEMLYNGLMAELIGLPAGYAVNILLRFFPKRVLREIIDTVREGIVDVVVLHTPSMLALVPGERYPAIEQTYLAGDEYAYIRAQAHPYYEAQIHLEERLNALREAGMEFYFISGYGLGFGGFSDDYTFFRFMESAEKTNSDEIIQISSTAPGTTYAPYNRKLDGESAYMSPDGSVDLSTSFDPEHTWCFYRQKHELEYNNTAIRLALEISMGDVTDVRSSAAQYPQFNESRDVKRLLRGDNTYLIRLRNYIADNRADSSKADEVALAQDALDRCNAMLAETHNNREADDAVIENARQALIQLGLEPPDSDESDSGIGNFFGELLHKLSDKVYDIFGAQGFIDKFTRK